METPPSIFDTFLSFSSLHHLMLSFFPRINADWVKYQGDEYFEDEDKPIFKFDNNANDIQDLILLKSFYGPQEDLWLPPFLGHGVHMTLTQITL